MTDGACIAAACFRASRQTLSGHLAVLESTQLGSLISQRIQDTFSSSKTSFSRAIEGKVAELASTTHAELGLRLLGTMNSILGIAPRHYVSRRDFEDNAGEILTECLKLLKDEKVPVTDLRGLVQLTVSQMFGEIGRRFEKLHQDEQETILLELRKFIDALPEEQREEIRRRSGLNEVSDEYLRRAIVAGTLSTAFAGAVSIAGFSFYTGATSLLATLAGLVGLTLPFGVYTGLTSTIAVVANPLFFIPIVAGGGAWLYHGQNQKLRRRMASLVLVQLVIADASADQQNEADYEQALTTWGSAWNVVLANRQVVADVQVQVDQLKSQVSEQKRAIKDAEEQRARAKADREATFDLLAKQCSDAAIAIGAGAWGTAASSSGQKLRGLLSEKVRLDAGDSSDGVRKILNQVVTTAKKLALAGQISVEARTCAEALLSATEDVAIPAPARGCVSQLKGCEVFLARSAAELEALRVRERALRDELEKAYESLRKRKTEQSEAEGVFWGFEVLS